LVSLTNPLEIEPYSYADVFFVLVEKHTHWSRERKHYIGETNDDGAFVEMSHIALMIMLR